jgi:GT2 family glycosyltransferase
MHSKPLISVVITTYNRSDALVQVLRALAHQDSSGFEVIVADDGSTQAHQDAMSQEVQTMVLPVTHVWHPDVGFTASKVRNRGVAAAKGDYIVFLDGDCVPEADFIRQHLRLREAGCFVNGSRVMLSKNLTARVTRGDVGIVGQGPIFWLQQRLVGDASKLTGLMRLPDFSFRKRVGFRWRGIRSCNMGVWRSDFERVNGFDESFVGWGHEDADFVLRLHNAGVMRKNGYAATEVYHLWHPESSRQQESANAARVQERVHSGVIASPEGYAQSRTGAEMVIKSWN